MSKKAVLIASLILGLVIILLLFFAAPFSEMLTLALSNTLHVPPHSPSDEALVRAQNDLDLMNTVLAVLGSVLTAFTIGAGILAFFGFSTLRDMQSSQERTRQYEKELHEKVDSFQKQIEEVKTALSYLIRGNQLVEDQKVDQAIEIFEKARNLRKHDPQINYDLGQAYSLKGLYTQAIDCFQTAVEADSLFPQAQFALGLNYRYRASKQHESALSEKDYEQAINHLKKALDLRPNYWEVFGTLGGLYRRRKEYETALYYYQRAYDADPTTSYGPGNIACLSLYLGEVTRAQEYFRRTKKLAQDRIATGQQREPYWDYYDLAMVQFVLGSLDHDEDEKRKAIETYKEAIRKTTSREAYDGVIGVLQLLKDAKDNPVDTSEIIKMLESAQSKHI